MPKNSVYDPIKVSRIKDDFIMLTKVNTRPLKVIENGSSAWIRIGGGQLSLHETEAMFPWMDMGYVVTDQPRTVVLTTLIAQNTIGYAIADTRTYEVVANFKTYGEALSACEKANAGLQFGVEEEPVVLGAEVKSASK